MFQNFKIEEFNWSQLYNEVHKINPQLAIICNQLNLTSSHSIFKLKYPYGIPIVNKGKFNIINSKNDLVPIDHLEVPSCLKEKLNYSSIPLSLIVTKNIEVFFETENNSAIPLNVLKTGELFGLFEINNLKYNVKNQPIWSVSSGGRSVYMLPDISDISKHKKIKKEFGITLDAPNTRYDHWKIFANIYKNSSITKNFETTLFIFSNKWFEKINNKNTCWDIFYNFLSESYSEQLKMLGNVSKINSLVMDSINSSNLQIDQYLIDTLQHIISIANNTSIAFEPSNNEEMLPTNLIQNVYLNYYGLNDYIPNIIQTSKINISPHLYYSLSYPIIISALESNFSKNINRDIYIIKKFLKIFLKKENKEAFLSKTKFKILDSDGVINSMNIIKHDNRFKYSDFKNLNNKTVYTKNPFFQGCISINFKHCK